MSNSKFIPETDETRFTQLFSMTLDLAEKKIREGTASSQLITQIMKMGSTREQLELENLRQQNRLSNAKTDALNREAQSDEKLEQVVEAMKRYGAHSSDV